MQVFLKRWRWWLLVTCAALTAYFLLPGLGVGITERNANRITVGMTRKQVEAILGPPNDFQRRQRLEKLAQETPETDRTRLVKAALERRKAEGEYWDGYSYGHWGRHVSIAIYYDVEGGVTRKQVANIFWRYPWEW
jgi:hypothetical protein